MDNPIMNESNVAKFVKSDYDYYIEAAKKKHVWNWASFFFGGFWLAYRKMYLLTALYVALLAFSFSIIGNSFNVVAVIVLSIILGAYGNKVYLAFAHTKIKKVIRRHTDTTTQDNRFSKIGGTSVFPPIILALSPFIVGILIQNLFPESGIFPIPL